MRFIDTTGLVLPPGWEEKAKEALAAVAALVPGARAEAINRRAAIWAELKPRLQALSYNKCWYCESEDPRSDNAVDHFRPKNSVKGSARFPLSRAHPGYWWLAFDYRNYRFCCTFCNSIRRSAAGTSGGKQDCFPLWDEGHRAWSADDDQERELPILLDPTNPADIGALWFDDSGQVWPRPKREQEPDGTYRRYKERTEESVAAYHLNHPTLTEARQQLAKDIRFLAADADKWLRRMHEAQEEADQWRAREAGVGPEAAAVIAQARVRLAAAHRELAVAEATYAARLAALRRVSAPQRQYSAAAHCIMRGMRRTSLSVEILLAQQP